MEEKKSSLIFFGLKIFLIFIVVELITQFGSSFISNTIDIVINFGKYSSLFLFEMSAFLIVLFVLKLSKNLYVFKERKIKLFKSILIGLPILIVSLYFLIISIISLVQKGESLNIVNFISLLLFTFSIGLYEELLCRGWIQNEFIERFGSSRKRIITSIIISGLIFGLMHSTNFLMGQNLFETIRQVIQTTALGILLGSIYYRTKNIWSVIFLHAFYDFSIMLSNVNLLKDCTTNIATQNELVLLSIVSSIIIILFYILASIILLRKNKIDQPIENDMALNEKNQASDKKKRVVLIIIACILISGYFVTIHLAPEIDEKAYTCYSYEEMEIEKYETHYFNYEDFTIDYTKEIESLEEEVPVSQNYNFSFSLNEDKVIIKNMNTQKEITLDYENVVEYEVFENEANYVILIHVYDKSSEIYYSDFISKDNISNEESYLKDINKSFKKFSVPDITTIGYLIEYNSEYKYPLIKSDIYDIFIIKEDKKIYLLK